MQSTQRMGTTAVSGKHLLAGGIVAAGLMAAGVAGAGSAAASPADAGSETSQSASAADGPTGPSRVSERGDARAFGRSGTSGEPAARPHRRTIRPRADVGEAAADETRTQRRDRTRRAERSPVVDEIAAPRHSQRLSPRGTRNDAESVEPDRTRVAVAAPARISAAGSTPDAALVAAASSTRVTIGSMIVDSLYSMGIRSRRMGTDWLDIPVSQAKADRWLVRRQQIYRDILTGQPTGPTGPTGPSGPTEPSPPAQPGLLWESNFSSREEALKYWGSQTGRWGQSAGENQYYTDGDNISIDADGNLVIEARRERAPDGLGAPYNYTSARVVTYGKQSIGVGTRVEARIQVPVDQGLLPAFWTVGLEPGHEFDWPRQGEIDIMEIPGFGTPASRRIWTGNVHGPAKGNNGVDVKLDDIDADLGVDLSAGFHTYGMDWYADRIIWRVDGVEVGRVTKAQYEARGGDWTPFSGKWEHYLILNVAVGNPWTGDPSASAPLDAEMKVDWVRAYKL